MKKNYSNLLILILSLAGLVLSLYLSYLHYTESQAAFCGQGSGCDEVRQSAYSTMLGVPVAVFGVVGYLIICALLLSAIAKRTKWLLLYIFTLAGFIFSAYLTYVEFFVLGAVCKYCIISALIMTAIFILVLTMKAELNPRLSMLRTAVTGIVVIIVVVTGSMAFHSGIVPGPDPAGIEATDYQINLARHLASRHAVMYGSFKCPHCLDQKNLFGGAFEYIRYVECHPGGPDANSSLCFAKGIRNYPTWEIDGRYYEGAKTLEQLSEISGFAGN